MRLGGPDRKVGEERVGTWTGPCWQGRPVLPLSRAGPPWSSSPLGRQMLSQDTWLTPWVLEAAVSCHLQAPAEHSSSSWSGLQGRSGSLWIQMRSPLTLGHLLPSFLLGAPLHLGSLRHLLFGRISPFLQWGPSLPPAGVSSSSILCCLPGSPTCRDQGSSWEGVWMPRVHPACRASDTVP